MPFRDDRSFRIERLEAELATAIAERDAARADRDAIRAELGQLRDCDRYLARSAQPTETPFGEKVVMVLFCLVFVIFAIKLAVYGFSTPVAQH